MARKMTFDPEDEDFFGSVGSFGVPKFDSEMPVSYTHLTLPTIAGV